MSRLSGVEEIQGIPGQCGGRIYLASVMKLRVSRYSEGLPLSPTEARKPRNTTVRTAGLPSDVTVAIWTNLSWASLFFRRLPDRSWSHLGLACGCDFTCQI
jgi:hypothetical protein